MIRDVFVCRLVIVAPGILHYPNCGQRVADDHAAVPSNVCWFLGCIRSTSPKPEELSNMQFALVVFRCVVQGSFPSTFVVQGQTCLQGDESPSHRPFMCKFSCLLPAHYTWACSSTLQNGIFHLWGDFCRKRAATSQSSSKSFHVCAWGPSCVVLHVLSYQSSTVPPWARSVRRAEGHLK